MNKNNFRNRYLRFFIENEDKIHLYCFGAVVVSTAATIASNKIGVGKIPAACIAIGAGVAAMACGATGLTLEYKRATDPDFIDSVLYEEQDDECCDEFDDDFDDYFGDEE